MGEALLDHNFITILADFVQQNTNNVKSSAIVKKNMDATSSQMLLYFNLTANRTNTALEIKGFTSLEDAKKWLTNE